MFGRNVPCDSLFTAPSPKRRRLETARFAFCSLSALAVVFAVTGRIFGDGFDWGWGWGSGRVCANAHLRVSLPEGTLSRTDGQNMQAEFAIFKNTQTQLLSSPMVLRAALKRPGVADLEIIKKQQNPLEWLGRNLRVLSPADSEIVQVSLGGAEPKELATLVNAVVDAYMAEIVDADRAKREQRIAELKRIQNEKSQELKDSLADLRRMAEQLGTTDTEALSQKQKILLDELATVRAASISNQFELNRMVAELASRKAERDAVESQPISDVEVRQACPKDPILHDLALQIAEMSDYMESIAGTEAKDSRSPSFIRTLGQMQRLQDKYNARSDQLKADIMAKKKGEIEREVRKLEASIEIAKKQIEVSVEELKAMKKEADRIGAFTIDMQMRKAAITSMKKSPDKIADEIERLRLESLVPPRVIVLEKAEVPE